MATSLRPKDIGAEGSYRQGIPLFTSPLPVRYCKQVGAVCPTHLQYSVNPTPLGPMCSYVCSGEGLAFAFVIVTGAFDRCSSEPRGGERDRHGERGVRGRIRLPRCRCCHKPNLPLHPTAPSRLESRGLWPVLYGYCKPHTKPSALTALRHYHRKTRHVRISLSECPCG
jgi:hypothetical protein